MMKKSLIAIFLTLLLVGSVSAKITLPKADEIKLDNGLTVKVIERSNLPLFSLQMTFKAGSIYDPLGKEGLASFTIDMVMRGTPTRDAKQIANEIAFGGGILYSFCGRESAGFTGEFLSSEGEKGFEILGDMLTNASLTEDEITKTRTRAVAGLESRIDDPSEVATEHIFRQLLGDSRYAHLSSGKLASVKSLVRDDVVSFVSDFYTPDNCILVVCGDIDKATVKSYCEKYFGDWKGNGKVRTVDETFQEINGKEVLVLNREDATQTQIRIGLPGIPIEHPDFFPLEVARTIYAGSFTSRLTNEIRVNRGLSYGVRYASHRFRPGGIAYVSTFTKNESVGEVLSIILTESERMQSEAIPDSEFVGGINYRTGLYPSGFETSDDIASVYSDLWLYDLDKSRYEDYQEKLRAVTTDQAMAAAQKYFPLENYRVILVGKATEVQTQAEQYGPVTVKEITTD